MVVCVSSLSHILASSTVVFGDARTRNSYWQCTCNGLSGTNTTQSHLGLMATYDAAPFSWIGFTLHVCFKSLHSSANLMFWHWESWRNTWCKWWTKPQLQLQIQPAIIPSVRANQSTETLRFTSLWKSSTLLFCSILVTGNSRCVGGVPCVDKDSSWDTFIDNNQHL